jgi:hypothetical protein
MRTLIHRYFIKRVYIKGNGGVFMKKKVLILTAFLVSMGLVTKPIWATSTTDIRVETNGVVKEFHAEGDEKVNYQSDDGSVKVKVNNATNEVEVATGSNEVNDNFDDKTEIADKNELNLVDKMMDMWEEWTKTIKNQLSELFR